jgi:hypothetical protein
MLHVKSIYNICKSIETALSSLRGIYHGNPGEGLVDYLLCTSGYRNMVVGSRYRNVLFHVGGKQQSLSFIMHQPQLNDHDQETRIS